jgi:ubiquinone/menaquinone biosynthesis C-methylase UbiE
MIFSVLPFMGKLIAKNQDAYKYLAESITKFPKQEEFLQMVSNAKFKDVYYKNLSNGVVAIHGGIK